MALAREWDDLVDEVRGLPGFEEFLRPPKIESLLGAAKNGPVVVLNVSRWRCDALIVTAAGVRVKKLPSLDERTVIDRVGDYLRVLQPIALDTDAPSSDASSSDAPSSEDPVAKFVRQTLAYKRARHDREETLRSTMEWLWTDVVGPVLDELGFGDPPPPWKPSPRVWWCPTGLLTLLPLHGAGYHRGAEGPSGRTVLDRVVSSYVPTLRVLRQAQAPRTYPKESTRMLFVGAPDTPGLPHLEEVRLERDLLRRLLGPRITVLDGPDATVAKVWGSMGNHRWVHFSGHADQDLVNPSRAGFRLADGLLSIPHISEIRSPGEFAFLGACRTNTGGARLPDEVITLAAALSYTGYRHVIATLWDVQSDVGALVTHNVYKRLVWAGRVRSERSAVALHKAVQYLRDHEERPLSEWLPFTHIGP
jgi:hypothetical protein